MGRMPDPADSDILLVLFLYFLSVAVRWRSHWHSLLHNLFLICTPGGSTVVGRFGCSGFSIALIFEITVLRVGTSSLTGEGLLAPPVESELQFRAMNTSLHPRHMNSLRVFSAFPTVRADRSDTYALGIPAPPYISYHFSGALTVTPTQIRPKEC